MSRDRTREAIDVGVHADLHERPDVVVAREARTPRGDPALLRDPWGDVGDPAHPLARMGRQVHRPRSQGLRSHLGARVSAPRRSANTRIIARDTSGRSRIMLPNSCRPTRIVRTAPSAMSDATRGFRVMIDISPTTSPGPRRATVEAEPVPPRGPPQAPDSP